MTDPIIEEANRQRQHERKLAEINHYAADNARMWRYGVVICMLVTIVLVAFIGGLVTNAQHARSQHERDMQHMENIAKECIDAGNIWINNACLLTKKSS